MGLLDDAIRQHLELKRAHGADEAELQRKESEALGPVRRETEPAAEDGGQEPVAPEGAIPEEAESAGEPVAFDDDDPFGGDEPFADAPSAVEDAPVAVEDTLPPVDEPAPVEEDPFEEDRFEEDAVPTADPPVSNTPTRGFDALSEDDPDEPFADEPAPAAPEPPAGDPPSRGAGGEDVLEETPEFLQETPEHDRLWFEQKPPRDFDFNDDK